jgi:hypothetical protein
MRFNISTILGITMLASGATASIAFAGDHPGSGACMLCSTQDRLCNGVVATCVGKPAGTPCRTCSATSGVLDKYCYWTGNTNDYCLASIGVVDCGFWNNVGTCPGTLGGSCTPGTATTEGCDIAVCG